MFSSAGSARTQSTLSPSPLTFRWPASSTYTHSNTTPGLRMWKLSSLFPLGFSLQPSAWRPVQSCQNVTSPICFLGFNNKHWIYQDFLFYIQSTTSRFYQLYEHQKLVLLFSMLTSYPSQPSSNHVSSSLTCKPHPSPFF